MPMCIVLRRRRSFLSWKRTNSKALRRCWSAVCSLNSYCQIISLCTELIKILHSLASCVEVVIVFVGPSETKFVCHKAVLGHWSEFFDVAFYGNLKEAAEGTVRLPEEDKTAFEAFIGWAYSGHINSNICPEELWALGDRLQSPRFSNAVMFLMFDGYNDNDTIMVSTKSVETAFSNTVEGSKLQEFLVDVINNHGPLCKAMLRREDASGYVRDWQRLIKGGGELVLQIVQKVSLVNDAWSGEDILEDEELPWWHGNQHKHLLPIKSRPLEDFVQGKKRSRLL